MLLRCFKHCHIQKHGLGFAPFLKRHVGARIASRGVGPCGSREMYTTRSSLVQSRLRALDDTQTGPVTSAAPMLAPSIPKVEVSPAQLEDWEGDLLVIAVPQDQVVTSEDKTVKTFAGEALGEVDKQLGGVLTCIGQYNEFEGKKGQTSKVLRGDQRVRHVALVGLGDPKKLGLAAEWGTSAFQDVGAAAVSLAKANKCRRVGVMFSFDLEGKDLKQVVAKMTSGAVLAGYETTRFKSSSQKGPFNGVESLELFLPSGTNQEVTEGAEEGTAIALGATLTRYLVEAPPNVCTPSYIAEAARQIAEAHPDVFSLEVLDKEQCEEMNMGSYLAVAEASLEPPKFVHLTYRPKTEVKKKVAIIGKGLTFDSGGYNLKTGPGSMIEMMKFDMGGSAAVLGAAKILGQLQPDGVEVHVIVASCENMVSGRGLRPGDVITAASGKTIEVNNTDAEGRLTLADAMWFAQEKCGATAMVDIATLTGACMIALGTEVAGMFTPSDDMAASLNEAARISGEKIWRMPLETNYFEQLKSPIADMKNTGTRFGGSITAALFLKEFVKEGVEWAHIDMAGPVWDSAKNVGTGYGAALLAEWAMAQGKSAA